MANKPSQIECGIDFQRTGHQVGYLHLSYSDNEHALSVIPVPIAQIANGDGPTVLLSAGTHGDEYEGQVILRRLIQELTPEQVNGRLIIMPALNFPAVRAASRTSPLDGANMNRVFPGCANGGPTAAIAHFVNTRVLPICQAGIDLHSGGKASEYLPSVFFARPDNDELNREMLAMAQDFAAPITMTVQGGEYGGDFDGCAHAQGVAFLSTELGGAGTVGLDALRIGEKGLYRMLGGLGVVSSDLCEVADVPTRFVEMNPGGYLHAPVYGLFECYVDLGSEVEVGQPLAGIYAFDELRRPPFVLASPYSGTMIFRRIPTLCKPGDFVVGVATDIARECLL